MTAEVSESVMEAGLGEIRAATLQDVDEIHALNRESFPEAWTREGLANAVASEDTHLVIQRDTAGHLVAYCLYQAVADEVHILQLAVAPPYRRQGVGRALTLAVLKDRHARGARLAWLEVRVSNEAARALYAGLGFSVTGRRKAYYTPLRPGMPREDALLMRCLLKRIFPGD